MSPEEEGSLCPSDEDNHRQDEQTEESRTQQHIDSTCFPPTNEGGSCTPKSKESPQVLAPSHTHISEVPKHWAEDSTAPEESCEGSLDVKTGFSGAGNTKAGKRRSAKVCKGTKSSGEGIGKLKVVKARSSYNFYLWTRMAELKAENTVERHRDRFGMAAGEWKTMSVEERQPYEKMANEDKNRFRKDVLIAGVTSDPSLAKTLRESGKSSTWSTKQSQALWTGGHDTLCVVCQAEGDFLSCSFCPVSYHLRCLRSPVCASPEGTWACPECKAKDLGESCSDEEGTDQVERGGGRRCVGDAPATTSWYKTRDRIPLDAMEDEGCQPDERDSPNAEDVGAEGRVAAGILARVGGKESPSGGRNGTGGGSGSCSQLPPRRTLGLKKQLHQRVQSDGAGGAAWLAHGRKPPSPPGRCASPHPLPSVQSSPSSGSKVLGSGTDPSTMMEQKPSPRNLLKHRLLALTGRKELPAHLSVKCEEGVEVGAPHWKGSDKEGGSSRNIPGCFGISGGSGCNVRPVGACRQGSFDNFGGEGRAGGEWNERIDSGDVEDEGSPHGRRSGVPRPVSRGLGLNHSWSKDSTIGCSGYDEPCQKRRRAPDDRADMIEGEVVREGRATSSHRRMLNGPQFGRCASYEPPPSYMRNNGLFPSPPHQQREQRQEEYPSVRREGYHNYPYQYQYRDQNHAHQRWDESHYPPHHHTYHSYNHRGQRLPPQTRPPPPTGMLSAMQSYSPQRYPQPQSQPQQAIHPHRRHASEPLRPEAFRLAELAEAADRAERADRAGEFCEPGVAGGREMSIGPGRGGGGGGRGRVVWGRNASWSHRDSDRGSPGRFASSGHRRPESDGHEGRLSPSRPASCGPDVVETSCREKRPLDSEGDVQMRNCTSPSLPRLEWMDSNNCNQNRDVKPVGGGGKSRGTVETYGSQEGAFHSGIMHTSTQGDRGHRRAWHSQSVLSSPRPPPHPRSSPSRDADRRRLGGGVGGRGNGGELCGEEQGVSTEFGRRRARSHSNASSGCGPAPCSPVHEGSLRNPSHNVHPHMGGIYSQGSGSGGQCTWDRSRSLPPDGWRSSGNSFGGSSQCGSRSNRMWTSSSADAGGSFRDHQQAEHSRQQFRGGCTPLSPGGDSRQLQGRSSPYPRHSSSGSISPLLAAAAATELAGDQRARAAFSRAAAVIQQTLDPSREIPIPPQAQATTVSATSGPELQPAVVPQGEVEGRGGAKLSNKGGGLRTVGIEKSEALSRAAAVIQMSLDVVRRDPKPMTVHATADDMEEEDVTEGFGSINKKLGSMDEEVHENDRAKVTGGMKPFPSPSPKIMPVVAPTK